MACRRSSVRPRYAPPNFQQKRHRTRDAFFVESLPRRSQACEADAAKPGKSQRQAPPKPGRCQKACEVHRHHRLFSRTSSNHSTAEACVRPRMAFSGCSFRFCLFFSALEKQFPIKNSKVRDRQMPRLFRQFRREFQQQAEVFSIYLANRHARAVMFHVQKGD